MGKERIAMSKQSVLRWMLEFGTDWVEQARVRGSWADEELYWEELDEHGWLKIRDRNVGECQIRLTHKAIKSLEESKHG
jgi:hypothetical protein